MVYMPRFFRSGRTPQELERPEHCDWRKATCYVYDIVNVLLDIVYCRLYTSYKKPTAAVSDVAPWSLILVDCVASHKVIVDSALGVALGSMAVG